MSCREGRIHFMIKPSVENVFRESVDEDSKRCETEDFCDGEGFCSRISPWIESAANEPADQNKIGDVTKPVIKL